MFFRNCSIVQFFRMFIYSFLASLLVDVVILVTITMALKTQDKKKKKEKAAAEPEAKEDETEEKPAQENYILILTSGCAPSIQEQSF